MTKQVKLFLKFLQCNPQQNGVLGEGYSYTHEFRVHFELLLYLVVRSTEYFQFITVDEIFV